MYNNWHILSYFIFSLKPIQNILKLITWSTIIVYQFISHHHHQKKRLNLIHLDRWTFLLFFWDLQALKHVLKSSCFFPLEYLILPQKPVVIHGWQWRVQISIFKFQFQRIQYLMKQASESFETPRNASTHEINQ